MTQSHPARSKSKNHLFCFQMEKTQSNKVCFIFSHQTTNRCTFSKLKTLDELMYCIHRVMNGDVLQYTPEGRRGNR